MPLDKNKLDKIFSPPTQQNPQDFDSVDAEDDENEGLDLMEEEDDGIPLPEVIPEKGCTPISTSDLQDDFQYARKSTENLMNKSNQLVQIALANAATGNARDIEVAATAINSAAAAISKLMDVHKDYQKVSSVTGEGNTFIQNQTINITTAELLKQLEEQEQKTVDVV